MEIENENVNKRLRSNSKQNLRNVKPKTPEAENYIRIEEEDDNNNIDDSNNHLNDFNKNSNMQNVETGYSFNNMDSNVFDEKNINTPHEPHNKNIHNQHNINTINTTQNKNQISDKTCEEEEEEDEISNSPIYNIICNIVPSKNQVVLYNVDKDCIIRKNINFSPLLGINHFLQDCAWVNNNNKLYILGGMSDDSLNTKIFLEYDPIKDKMRRLPDSKYTHSRHSLFAYDNQIFVIGGDRLECEKYDINKNEWSTLPNLSFKQIYPVLYVHNDIIYSFFGIDENIRKTDCVQKLNLKNNKAKWQKVVYKKNKCNLCVFGCGIAKINENCVLFLGGMDDNGIRDEAIQFDFNNLSAKKTEYLLEEKAYFKDSVLLRLSPNDFGNFSIEETNPFLKIKFQFNVKKMTN
jgi:hypothetical protein